MGVRQLGHLIDIRCFAQVTCAVPEVDALACVAVEKRMDHGAQRGHAGAATDEHLLLRPRLEREVAKRPAEIHTVPRLERIPVSLTLASGLALLSLSARAEAYTQGSLPPGFPHRPSHQLATPTPS